MVDPSTSWELERGKALQAGVKVCYAVSIILIPVV